MLLISATTVYPLTHPGCTDCFFFCVLTNNLQALVDHLVDNPSDVVGLELGPGDEPLLPGTLLPMRNVRSTDNPPQPFPSSMPMGVEAGGSGGIDVGGGTGKGGSPTQEAHDGGGGGDGAGGAKTDSMRRWGNGGSFCSAFFVSVFCGV